MFFAGGQNRKPWPELAQQDRPRQQACPCPEASGDWVGRKDRAEPARWSVALPCCCPELMGWFLLVARETDVSKLTGKPNVSGASHFCLFIHRLSGRMPSVACQVAPSSHTLEVFGDQRGPLWGHFPVGLSVWGRVSAGEMP